MNSLQHVLHRTVHKAVLGVVSVNQSFLSRDYVNNR